MTITAQSVIKTVQEELQDVSGVRWSAIELVGHLNDGQRDIATVRPDLYVITAPLVLLAGAKQSLPDVCINLVEIVRNTGGQAIKQVSRNMLDALNPSWYTSTQSATIKEFMYDTREPDAFYVNPPAVASTSIDAVYSTMPSDVPTPGGAAYTTVTGNISGKDTAKNALIHFILFRAFMKDAEFGGNAAMSAAHYQTYSSLLASDVSAGQATKPSIQDAP